MKGMIVLQEEKKKDNFILYNNMYEMLEELTNEEVGDIIKSVFRYSIEGTLPQYEKGSANSLVFKSIKTSIDINNEKYKETCIKNADKANRRWTRIIYNNQEMNEGQYKTHAFFEKRKETFEEVLDRQKELASERQV